MRTRGFSAVSKEQVRHMQFDIQSTSPGTMSSDTKIAELKRQLGETVQRIDTIQQGSQLSLTSRISRHFRTQSGSLINVVLTASVFAVALGKMQQKQHFQVHNSISCTYPSVSTTC